MSGPRPWRETGEAPAGVAALLRHARPARPLDSESRERSRRRVAALSSVPAAASTFLWLQHAALGAVLGVAVTSAAIVLPRAFTHRDQVGSAPQTGEGATRPLPAGQGATESTAMVAAPEAVPPDAPASASVRASGEATSGLAREARLLERARGLLARNPSGALGAVTEHEAEFPHGALELERQLLKVEALVRLGRRSEAEGVARALRTRAPGSLYERRLSTLLGETP